MGNIAPTGQKEPKKKKEKKEKPRYEAPIPTTIGKKKKKKHESTGGHPQVTPSLRCRLRLLKLQRIHDYLLLEQDLLDSQEERDGDENDQRRERETVDELRGTPMAVCTLEEIVDDEHAIVSSPMGPDHYVSIMSFTDKDCIEPGCTVLCNYRDYSVVGTLPDDLDSTVDVMRVEKAPRETYSDVGGLEEQIQEIKEAVELPLTNPELYEEMGIKAPKGIILYGSPGTGKTLLAKAVANKTSATFMRVVGSELIQKYLGEGPKLVRSIFACAAENAPTIVFIDEIDAIGTKRYESSSGGEREIQRTMLELLNQLDGFDANSGVKVIMATNRIESLDPALIRPGRIDRKVEFPLPDVKTKRKIFGIHTGKMSLCTDVDIERLIPSKSELSGADIKAICTEAGLLALRERRMQINMNDFVQAKEKVQQQKKDLVSEKMYF